MALCRQKSRFYQPLSARAKFRLPFRNEENGPARAPGLSIARNLSVPCQFTLAPITTTPILVCRDFPKGHDSGRTRSLQPYFAKKMIML